MLSASLFCFLFCSSNLISHFLLCVSISILFAKHYIHFGVSFWLLVRLNWLFIVCWFVGRTSLEYYVIIIKTKKEKIRKCETLERIKHFCKRFKWAIYIGIYETMNGIVLVSDNCFGQIAFIHSFIFHFILSSLLHA